MAIDPNSSYRLGFYYPKRETNQLFIQQDPLSREQAIQAVKDKYNPNDKDTDVFVAVFFALDESDNEDDADNVNDTDNVDDADGPEEVGYYARDEEATKRARQASNADSYSSTAGSKPPTPKPTPSLPADPAAQAAEIATKFFPVEANESDSQRQERADAEDLFIKYPFTAKDLWSRFNKPTKVEANMFDIWETKPPRYVQGPEAARDMVRDNIKRMKDSKRVFELDGMEELLKDDA